MSTPAATDPENDPCILQHQHGIEHWRKSHYRHECELQTHHTVGSVDNTVKLLGGFLGAADEALNSEMALEATDSSYGDYTALGASPDLVHHAHGIQHGDIALRAISSIFGYTHSLMSPQTNAAFNQGASMGSNTHA